MSWRDKLKSELKTVLLTTLYFAFWFGSLMLAKSLILAEYHIEFRGLSAAFVGALIVAKVVLLAEHVPLGRRVDESPAIVEVLLRTAIYSIGVVIVLLLEKAFEARHEYGGFLPALRQVFHHRDIHHVWATVICVSGVLLSFNVLTVLRNRLDDESLVRILLSPRASPKGGKLRAASHCARTSRSSA